MPKKVVFNDEQLKELKQLMDQNVRQTDIAKHFHVTDDTIRRICRENDLEIKMPHKCVCIICREVFYSNIKGAKVCKKEHHRKCVICGNDFIVNRTDVRETCSGECECLRKYGVKHAQGLPQAIEKRKETCLESLRG